MMDVEDFTPPPQQMASLESRFRLQRTIINALPTGNEEDNTYVFATSCNSTFKVLAAAASNNLIKLYDLETYEFIGHIEGHQKAINEVCFAHTHPDVLFSCSNDRTIRLWDIRDRKPGPAYNGPKEFFSFSLNASDTQLASGSRGGVYVWDVRSTEQLRLYKDFHMDDITQVRHHPVHASHVYTASVDGTVCVFETECADEDDAMIQGFSVDGDSIGRIDFFGPASEYFACMTNTERLTLWSIDGTRIADFGDKREALSTPSFPVNYMICCKYDPTAQQVLLFVGNHDGGMAIAQLTPDDVRVVSVLESAHASTIRSVELFPQRGKMITAGEDARVCFWDAAASASSTAPMDDPMMPKKAARTRHQHRDKTRPY